MDWIKILEKIAVPRPDHRETLAQVAVYIQELLAGWGIPFVVQPFSLRPHAMMLWGVGVLALSAVFAFLIVKRRPLLAMIPLGLIPVFVFLEVECAAPILSAAIQKPAENIIVGFKAEDPRRELIFAAHYDSKTDLWDHLERKRIAKLFAPSLGFGLALILGAFLAGCIKKGKGKGLHRLNTAGAIIFVIYYGFVFSWWGGYIFLDSRSDSPGAVDDGGAVVTLLALSKHIQEGRVELGSSNVTILLTAGEEVGFQGAKHFLDRRIRDKPAGEALPAFLVNLEFVGQNGNMVYFEKSGALTRFYPADPELIRRLDAAWQKVSGGPMDSRPSINDDSKVFGDAQIPRITVGHSGLPGRGLGDFHSIHDNMERVNPENLMRMVETLEQFIGAYGSDAGNGPG